MQQLSFTIPYTSSAIRATIGALTQMDKDLNGIAGLFAQGSEDALIQTGVRPIHKAWSGLTPAYRDVPNIAESAVVPIGEPMQSAKDGWDASANINPYSEQPVNGVGTPIDEPDTDDLPAQDGAFDSAGLPWDERIHSSSKAFLKSDGTWKLKKGVDKALVVQVTAELLGNAGTTPTPSSANTPPPPAEATTNTPPPPPATDAPAGASPFRQLLADIAKAGLAPDYVQTTCQEVNGCGIPQCKDDAEKLSMLRMSLGL